MGTYILKRVFLMLFTLVLVSFLIFIIIRLAPGRAGQVQSAQGESAEDTGSIDEAYILFKLQNGLNLPLVLNTRYNLSIEDVEQAVITVAENVSAAVSGEEEALLVAKTTGSLLSRILYPEYYEISEQLTSTELTEEAREQLVERQRDLPYDPHDQIRPARPSPELLVEARENLEDWGIYAVPALYELSVGLESRGPPSADGLAENCSRLSGPREPGCFHPNIKVRWIANRYLSLNAQDRQPDAETGALLARYPELSNWKYQLEDDVTQISSINSQWRNWFQENRDRFAYTSGDKLRILFTETGLYTYWSHLIQLDFGISSQFRRPVKDLIFEKWKYSIYLSLLSVFFAYFLSIPIGLYSAAKRGGMFDRFVGLILFLLYSLPSFFVGTILQDFFTQARGPDEVNLLLRVLTTGFLIACFSAFLSIYLKSYYKGKATPLILGISCGVVLGWGSAQLLFLWGAYLITFVFILSWPLYLSLKNWKQEKRQALAMKSDEMPPFPVAYWAGLVLAGCCITTLFCLMRDFFPAPVSGFSSDGLRQNATMWVYFTDILTHLVLPVACLTYGALAVLSRYARTGLLDVINSDYIRTARAKGLSEPVVILKHAVRNGMIPILTLLASTLPALVGGSVIIEFIFDIPGIGNLIYAAVLQKDFNVVMGVLLISAVMTLIGVLISDISYALVDPRITFD